MKGIAVRQGPTGVLVGVGERGSGEVGCRRGLPGHQALMHQQGNANFATNKTTRYDKQRQERQGDEAALLTK